MMYEPAVPTIYTNNYLSNLAMNDGFVYLENSLGLICRKKNKFVTK